MHTAPPIQKRLKEAREEAALSQKKLGILAGMDEFVASPRVNQYEKGVHIPPYETLTIFAKILSVPVEYFYTVEDDLAEILLLIHQLDHNKRKKLLGQLKQQINKMHG